MKRRGEKQKDIGEVEEEFRVDSRVGIESEKGTKNKHRKRRGRLKNWEHGSSCKWELKWGEGCRHYGLSGIGIERTYGRIKNKSNKCNKMI